MKEASSCRTRCSAAEGRQYCCLTSGRTRSGRGWSCCIAWGRNMCPTIPSDVFTRRKTRWICGESGCPKISLRWPAERWRRTSPTSDRMCYRYRSRSRPASGCWSASCPRRSGGRQRLIHTSRTSRGASTTSASMPEGEESSMASRKTCN